MCGVTSFAELDNALLLYKPGSQKGRSELTHSAFSGFLGGALSVFEGGEVRVATIVHTG